jgi:exodeoxyribonuclease-3
MKIVSWNVNSLNVRLPHVIAFCEYAEPDVLALQEIKMTDENFPAEALKEIGYECAWSGQKTYNGVAVLSRQSLADPVTDVPGLDDPQRRILAVTVGDVRVINLYVVNGSEVGSDKYEYKLKWLQHVTNYVETQLAEHKNVVVLGDFNIVPEDRDIYDPEEWHEKILCSTPEREALQKIMDLGLTDTFRMFDQVDRSFSWWDYRAAGFRRDLGMRIDLVLASKAMAERCAAASIDKEPRRQERPSDHTPVIAEFNMG